jgi:hypothetical protein
MIKVEHIEVMGWEAAIRGMRNPMNSWDKSDSKWNYAFETTYDIGSNDLKLMQNLVKAGSDHSKFMRYIVVTVDITAPLYWWKEFDTYKVGTVANSCSTMHKIHAKEFAADDFSFERVVDETLVKRAIENKIDVLNYLRERYLETDEKEYWESMIQMLPSSYNQKRTVMLNYEVLRNMYHARKRHKLKEWRDLCERIEKLPYSELIMG